MSTFILRNTGKTILEFPKDHLKNIKNSPILMNSIFPSSRRLSKNLLKLVSMNPGINYTKGFSTNSVEFAGYLKNPGAVSETLVIFLVWRDINSAHVVDSKRSTFISTLCKFRFVSSFDL